VLPVGRADPPAQGDAYLVGYNQRPEVLAYIDELVAKYGFDADELRNVFAHARYNDTVAGLMGPGPAARAVPWSEYRARFVEPTRIDAGVRFWQAHADDLERAQKIYGVPAQVIVAILDVETLFGRNMGNFRVIDALTTLAFDYPNKDRDRSPFFREQLTDYLLLARDQSQDVLGLRGSYAGAIGMPQFMPGSIRHYAVDFDGDGVIDLKNDASDAIGSVANFLASQGWRRGLPAAFPANLSESGHDEAKLAAFVDAGSEPGLLPRALADAGVILPEGLAPDETVALINLPDGDNPTLYLIGTRNFFVLTRYNRSYAYAESVLELGRAIRLRRFAAAPDVAVPADSPREPIQAPDAATAMPSPPPAAIPAPPSAPPSAPPPASSPAPSPDPAPPATDDASRPPG
jgi:membrane-bound lytic murein transglycosylase B